MGHRLRGVEGTYSPTSPETELGIAKGVQPVREESPGADAGRPVQWRGRRSS